MLIEDKVAALSDRFAIVSAERDASAQDPLPVLAVGGKSAQATPLLVFADDWGRHPSSCQHLIGHLLDRHDVCWVNTIGMRRPRLDMATVRRGLEKVRGWLRNPSHLSPVVPGPRVLNPRMWPWLSSAWDRRLNRFLLARQLMPVLKTLGQPPIVITTLPIVADLIDVLPAKRWVYYCVDDFGQWPGLDHTPLREMEATLVRRADLVIAVSGTLQDRIAQMGRDSRLLTHGVDLNQWSGKQDGETRLQAVEGMERPLIVFWGLVDRRMDTALIRRLAHDLERGTILFVGPEDDADPSLWSLPRVARVGPLPYGDLARIAQEASVLVMPYADLPVTRALQPLKLKEYLATGKPAVVRELPSVRAWSDCLDMVNTAEEFSRMTRLRIEKGLPASQIQARKRLSGESWPEKARLFENWMLASEVKS